MPLIPNFSAAQSLSSLSDIVLTDTSTGSASTSWRQVYVQTFNGGYLVPAGTTTDYIVWNAASSTKTIAGVLDKDYALVITVNWFVGSTSTYTKTILFLFKGYSEAFKLNLTRFLASNPKLANSSNFFDNYSKLQTLIDAADQAVSLGNDQEAAQLCLDMAKQLTDNQQYFF